METRRFFWMTDISKDAQDEMSPQYLAAKDALDAARYSLSRLGLLKREFASVNPSGTSEYTMSMVADLLDRRRRHVGSVRVRVAVPVDGKKIKYTIEWTRHIFGFWYRQEFVIQDGVDDPVGKSAKRLKEVAEPVRWTAHGVTRVKSMNRLFKKVKKNRTKDKAASAGMRVWR